MAVTVAQGEATNWVKFRPAGFIAAGGVLTGTSTLTPQYRIGPDGATLGVGLSSDPLTAVAFTVSFNILKFENPDDGGQDVYFRFANTSGTGSWAVEGPFTSAA